MRRNTGNYKIYKQVVGTNSKVELIKGSKNEVEEYLHSIEEPDLNYTYFLQEEVIYEKSHSDGRGNFFDSDPTWVNSPNSPISFPYNPI